MLKNTKRFVMMDMGTNNEMLPIEIPSLPSMAITYNSTDRRSEYQKNILSYKICRLENKSIISIWNTDTKPFRSSLDFDFLYKTPQLKFTAKTLHYVLESYHGYYDSDTILSKCIDKCIFQAASKISILDGHYGDSLGFQLLAFKKHIEKYTLDCLNTHNEKIIIADNYHNIDSNKININDKKLEFGFTNSSPVCMLSTSSSLDSIRQWGDEPDYQGGSESPCEGTDVEEVQQSITEYVQLITTDAPIISISKNIMNESKETNSLLPKNKIDLIVKDPIMKEVVGMGSQLVEFYIKEIYMTENHILMQNILLRCIEFWLNNNLPVTILEEILLKNLDKYFYPLAILLFCKNFNNGLDDNLREKGDCDKHQRPAGFLKEFSTKFCLQLCSMVLENATKS